MEDGLTADVVKDKLEQMKRDGVFNERKRRKTYHKKTQSMIFHTGYLKNDRSKSEIVRTKLIVTEACLMNAEVLEVRCNVSKY